MRKHRRVNRQNIKNGLRDKRVVIEIDDLFDRMATKWARRAEKLMTQVTSNTTPQKKHRSH